MLNVDPQLGPLANNGGSTQTHLPLPTSPAIDMGDPAFSSPPTYDQRGFAFARVVDGRVDIGAVESSAVSADFDLDGDVDGHDFLTWQRGFGTSPNATHSQGDADIDGSVAAADLAIWQLQYGTTPIAISAPTLGDLAAQAIDEADEANDSEHAAPRVERATNAVLIDAAMALNLRESQTEEKDTVIIDQVAFEAAFALVAETNESTSSENRVHELAATQTAAREASESEEAWFVGRAS